MGAQERFVGDFWAGAVVYPYLTLETRLAAILGTMGIVDGGARGDFWDLWIRREIP